jgi:hypothetical protein
MKARVAPWLLAAELWAFAARAEDPAPDHGLRAPAGVARDAKARDREQPGWELPVVHALAVMTGMRIGAAVIWPDPFADLGIARMADSYQRAYTEPPRWDSNRDAFEWDGDPWPVNVIGHGLFGSELFLRARTCGKSRAEALVFTTVASALWEYGFEASAVQPSALDLVYTPAAGLVLGELRYAGWSAAADIRDRTWRGVLRAVLDPLGEFERALGAEC